MSKAPIPGGAIEHNKDNFKYWLLIVVSIVGIFTYVWSSATHIQTIDSRSIGNEKYIKEFKDDTKGALQQINVKLDIINSKLK